MVTLKNKLNTKQRYQHMHQAGKGANSVANSGVTSREIVEALIDPFKPMPDLDMRTCQTFN